MQPRPFLNRDPDGLDYYKTNSNFRSLNLMVPDRSTVRFEKRISFRPESTCRAETMRPVEPYRHSTLAVIF